MSKSNIFYLFLIAFVLTQVRKAEKEAILDAIREHGSEASEFVIRKVLFMYSLQLRS